MARRVLPIGRPGCYAAAFVAWSTAVKSLRNPFAKKPRRRAAADNPGAPAETTAGGAGNQAMLDQVAPAGVRAETPILDAAQDADLGAAPGQAHRTGILQGTHNALKATGGKSVLGKGRWSRMLDAVKSYERAEKRSDGSSQSRQDLQARLDALLQRVETYIADHADDPGSADRVATAERLLPRLRVEHETLATGLSHGRNVKNQVGDISVLGEGASNAVFSSAFRGADGGEVAGVFKPDAGVQAGTLDEKRKENDRSVAAARADAFLGTDATVATEYASLGGTMGIVMDRAGGESLADTRFSPELEAEADVYRDFDYDDPRLQERLNALQWLDAFTGERDRHGGNVFVRQGPDGVDLQGIDNDGAFLEAEGDGMLGSLPSVIDAGLYDRLAAEDATPEAFVESLGSGIDEPTREIARERFERVRAHALSLGEEEGGVVGREGGAVWGDEAVSDRQDPTNSYWSFYKEQHDAAAANADNDLAFWGFAKTTPLDADKHQT